MITKHVAGYCLIWLLTCLTGCAMLNDYQDSGEITLKALEAPVTVSRDASGMAYIKAETIDDALTAHGFVTAQDRLFQMELMRLLTSGRISELIGEKGIATDRMIRTLGFARHARTHTDLLSEKTRHYFQQYLKGINAYIATRSDTYPLEFKLAGLQPSAWQISDSLTILYYMSWLTSANIKTEITAQMLMEKLGTRKASEIFPLNINPEDNARAETRIAGKVTDNYIKIKARNNADADITTLFSDLPLRLGSNNWVVNSSRSSGGKPILANDPHLDARILPGPWYPCGLFTPHLRVVGVGIPGIPGMVVFRTDHIAVGVTNSYADCQDLYAESPDPARPGYYLEDGRAFPFETIPETIKVKDEDAPGGFREEPVVIRLTHRGPVISGVLPGLETEKILTLRWAAVETMMPEIGLEQILFARTADEVRQTLSHVNMILLNFVFADVEGNIGWQTSGRLPIRKLNDATIPSPVPDAQDNWTGWLPFDRMPGEMNPPEGWVGTCNHKTVDRDYPYYYSSYFSPTFRYRRLKELIEASPMHSPGDHWQYQLDTKNLMAAELVPIITSALGNDPELAEMTELLVQWDFHDRVDSAAPTVFHEIYRVFARLVFEDELGPELTDSMLGNWYFWQERLHDMIMTGDSSWFDDTNTPGQKETRDQCLIKAAHVARRNLTERYGSATEQWQWGKVHQIEFVSPIRRSGFGKGLLGGGSHPLPGSGETLLRGRYAFNAPYDVTISASLRMVADLSDTEKVMAVLPGGVAGRVFHPHAVDQIDPFINGEMRYWWFSEDAIAANTVSQMVLSPSPSN